MIQVARGILPLAQRAFFNQPHSIGLVVDPIRLHEKWFIGPDSGELQDVQILRRHARASPTLPALTFVPR